MVIPSRNFDVPCLLYEIMYFSLFVDNKVSNLKNLISDHFSVRSIPTHTIVISSFTLVNRDKVKVHTLHIPLILFLLLSWNKEQIKLVKHPTTRMCTYVRSHPTFISRFSQTSRLLKELSLLDVYLPSEAGMLLYMVRVRKWTEKIWVCLGW